MRSVLMANWPLSAAAKYRNSSFYFHSFPGPKLEKVKHNSFELIGSGISFLFQHHPDIGAQVHGGLLLSDHFTLLALNPQ